MPLGHRGQLFLLAVDHRDSFRRLFGGTSAAADQLPQLRAAKSLVWRGLRRALDLGVPSAAVGLLVDDEMGAAVARQVRSEGLTLAMPVEQSGGARFDFAHGSDFRHHVRSFEPDLVKARVVWHPATAGVDSMTAQASRLRELGQWLHDDGRRLLLELAVPANDHDLAQVDGDLRRLDREIRPELTIRAVEQLLDADIDPDVWMVDGVESRSDLARLTKVMRAGEGLHGDRSHVATLVHGHGGNPAQFERELLEAAGVEGVAGFAAGRHVWAPGVLAWCNGTLDYEAAAAGIATSFTRFVDLYSSAA